MRNFLRKVISFLKHQPYIRKLLREAHDQETSLFHHENMTSDVVKIETYQKAIGCHINADDTVLDVGTGTGILSFLAHKQSPKKIYAIDSSSIINVAQKIASHNNINTIEFRQTKSFEYTPPEKVNVILHELIGNDLFNEDMINILLNLKKRTLKEHGKIIPGKFELFLEPVELHKDHKIPSIWDNNRFNLDIAFLKTDPSIHRQSALFHNRRFITPYAVNHLLCTPEPILKYDLNQSDHPPQIPEKRTMQRKTIREGQLDGFCLYFKVIFDDEISFDTSPTSPKTHWGNRFFRIKDSHLKAGEKISYTTSFNKSLNAQDWSIEINSTH